MASEAISSSIMIIGAVLGAAVLITAILPAIFSAGDTFGTVSSSAEQKLKTDFRIVNTYANASAVQVWMKNVGNNRISVYDVRNADVFLGLSSSNYKRYGYGSGTDGNSFIDSGTSIGEYWEIGETLEISILGISPASGIDFSFSFALPNSIRRTTTFTRS
ncbi:conserved hypothetical protein [Methanospirillum hungatei JF-1]|uniref:Flagellin n=1 Tax=Methanospirillum hungatei JF-1 (strain ATCC 27890 / DSM 864 / NBRC 100397 / JF-1) TaxID=323259 RepID=Q2FN28_METHJ|nr:hypothetical protein [Methanospirillum hungatei]ABD39879.1 conserved hypothetical protein [Methanospirillum hungatei JF-1]